MSSKAINSLFTALSLGVIANFQGCNNPASNSAIIKNNIAAAAKDKNQALKGVNTGIYYLFDFKAAHATLIINDKVTFGGRVVTSVEKRFALEKPIKDFPEAVQKKYESIKNTPINGEFVLLQTSKNQNFKTVSNHDSVVIEEPLSGLICLITMDHNNRQNLAGKVGLAEEFPEEILAALTKQKEHAVPSLSK